MWKSPNNDNPWLPFRRSLASRLRSRENENVPRIEETVGQTACCRSVDVKILKNYSDHREKEGEFYNYLDDNANANIFDKCLFPGMRHVPKCDKQTQTDRVLVSSVKHDSDRHPSANKVIYSKSCESLVSKPTIKARTSRSFDISTEVNKNHFERHHVTISPDNCSFETILKDLTTSEKSLPMIHAELQNIQKDLSMSNGFYERKYPYISPAEHQHMPKNISNDDHFSDIPNNMEQVHIKPLSDEDFCSDLESDLKNMSCRDKVEDQYKNQWSPFHLDRERDPMFYDYRQQDEVSLISERSCYSTTSEEADNDYEIIDWNQYTDDYIDEGKGTERRSEAFNTPPTTPVLDLSALDGYHTAPNSPDNPNKKDNSYSEVKNPRRFCVEEVLSDYRTSDEKRSADVKNFNHDGNDLTHHNILNNAQYDKNLCSKCGKSAEVCEGTFGVERSEINERNPHPQKQRLITSDSRILRLETPPFISVNSLHYEADQETGEAKIIGRGSFGQVYKARFSDPMFGHLPIVIKEFNEEFTNSKEIIEEAKRLYYLQDTGYVPICYGLLCFGSPIQPKYGIVQEYVGTGLTLEQMLWDQYELPLEFWFRIVIQCCEGLARFHEKGILLNDIKTNNILLEFAEHSVRIRYIDFGLATDMRGKRYKNTRSLEDFVYLAPEVRRNGRVTNIASDIYSLGYILEQIKTYTGVHELTVVARLCMDRDPDMRIPPRAAASLIKEHMLKLGYAQMIVCDL